MHGEISISCAGILPWFLNLPVQIGPRQVNLGFVTPSVGLVSTFSRTLTVQKWTAFSNMAFVYILMKRHFYLIFSRFCETHGHDRKITTTGNRFQTSVWPLFHETHRSSTDPIITPKPLWHRNHLKNRIVLPTIEIQKRWGEWRHMFDCIVHE